MDPVVTITTRCSEIVYEMEDGTKTTVKTQYFEKNRILGKGVDEKLKKGHNTHRDTIGG